MNPRTPWTENDIAMLRIAFADTTTGELARLLGRGYSAVAAKAAKLGLRKSAERKAKRRAVGPSV